MAFSRSILRNDLAATMQCDLRNVGLGFYVLSSGLADNPTGLASWFTTIRLQADVASRRVERVGTTQKNTHDSDQTHTSQVTLLWRNHST